MHVAVNCDDKCKLGGDEKYWQSMEIEQMHRELQQKYAGQLYIRDVIKKDDRTCW